MLPKCTAKYIDDHPGLVRGKTVVELGAGGALPSFVAADQMAEMVVITDYPDDILLDNIKYNVEHCGITRAGVCVVEVTL